MKPSKWDERIRRASELAKTHPSASEVLRFYERVAGFQGSLYSHIEAACGSAKEARAPGRLRDELDLFLLLPKFPQFLSLIESVAPAPMAQSAAEVKAAGAARWQDLLSAYWAGSNSEPPEDTPALFAWSFLQPYAEYLADHTEQFMLASLPSVCPLCGGKPQVGVLRLEGDGAKRSLICCLCSTEWNFRRMLCPSCGEEDAARLVIYTAEGFQHIRIEACDSCRHYIKTIDLTKNGRAVPVVDELAAIPLSLWAQENGYTKLQANLLGI